MTEAWSGVIRHCVRHHGVYRSAADDSVETYPGLCFEDRHQDGRNETAILLPCHPQQIQPRIMAITPVRLDPDPATSQSDLHALRVRRRIRIVCVGSDDVQLIADQGSVAGPRPNSGRCLNSAAQSA